MSRKPALGKGLKALIPESAETTLTGQPTPRPTQPGTWVSRIPVTGIRPNPHQPRRAFPEAELEELAASIREHGVLQPLLVRPVDGGYEIVSGERRLRAAKMAGLSEVPAILVDPDDRAGSLTIALVENVQREDLTCIDLARAYKRLQDEFGRTQEEIAAVVGKSRPHVANTLRLLELSDPIKDALQEGIITAGHARALMMAPVEARKLIFRRMVSEGISVRQAEKVARDASKPASETEKKSRRRADEDNSEQAAMLRVMAKAVETALGRKCVIERGRRGAGRLVLDFYDDRDLERLVEKLRAC